LKSQENLIAVELREQFAVHLIEGREVLLAKLFAKACCVGDIPLIGKPKEVDSGITLCPKVFCDEATDPRGARCVESAASD
jgi:hypothetical protein